MLFLFCAGIAQFNAERLVDGIRDIFAVLFALLDALSQKVFDLTVDRSEIVLRPRGNGGIQLFRQSKRQLFFLIIRHRRSIQAAGVNDGLRVAVAAEYDEQIGDHRRTTLLVQGDLATLL